MLTPEQHRELREKIATYEAWRNGRTAISLDVEATAPVHVTNEERSAVEVYEFVNDPPKQYFAYVKVEFPGKLGTPENKYGEVTTWMGDTLGGIYWRGNPFKSNMGDIRQNLRVRGINGKSYAGTYYRSTGDYCRLRMLGDKPATTKSAVVKRVARQLGYRVIDFKL